MHGLYYFNFACALLFTKNDHTNVFVSGVLTNLEHNKNYLWANENIHYFAKSELVKTSKFM